MKLFRWLRNKALPTVVGSDSFQTILASHGVPPVLLDKLEGVVERRAAQRIADDVAAKPVMTPKPKRNLMSEEEKEPIMPQLPMLPLSAIFLFKHYATREEYFNEFGVWPKDFDITKNPKSWFDPKASTSTRKNIVYDAVIALSENGTPLMDPNDPNVPLIEDAAYLKAEAAEVNIPPKGSGGNPISQQPMLPEAQVPLDLSKIPAGYKIGRFLGNIQLVPLNFGSGSTAGETNAGEKLDSIQAGINELKAQLTRIEKKL
jgi:hypothetical protein